MARSGKHGTKQNMVEDCRQWLMHHQVATGVSSKHTSNIYIYIYIYIRLKIKPNSVRIRF
jgi:hypothetical protein